MNREASGKDVRKVRSDASLCVRVGREGVNREAAREGCAEGSQRRIIMRRGQWSGVRREASVVNRE